MKKIGIISDTHGYFDNKLKDFLMDVDEIWHAGDIGSLALADQIAEFKPLRAVYGNIDGADTRVAYPKYDIWRCENINILMTHIGGYPGKYNPEVLEVIKSHKPQLFIAGHSHILKVQYDKKNELLHINPGAAGIYGFHSVRTAVRFVIDKDNMKDLEVGEWKKSF